MSNSTSAARHILTSAVEGPAITYWSEVRNVERGTDGYVTSFEVRDTDSEGPREQPVFIRIDEAAVRNTVQKALIGDVKMGRRVAAQFIGCEADWDFDNEGVDCIIQAANGYATLTP